MCWSSQLSQASMYQGLDLLSEWVIRGDWANSSNVLGPTETGQWLWFIHPSVTISEPLTIQRNNAINAMQFRQLTESNVCTAPGQSEYPVEYGFLQCTETFSWPSECEKFHAVSWTANGTDLNFGNVHFVALYLSFQFLVCGMCGVLCARKRTGLIVSIYIFTVVALFR